VDSLVGERKVPTAPPEPGLEPVQEHNVPFPIRARPRALAAENGGAHVGDTIDAASLRQAKS
jgi:hypothetical protein